LKESTQYIENKEGIKTTTEIMGENGSRRKKEN